MVDAAQDDRDNLPRSFRWRPEWGNPPSRAEWERVYLGPPPSSPPPVTIATLTAERDRYAAALDRIAGMTRVSADGVTVYETDRDLVEAMQAEAERAREGTK